MKAGAFRASGTFHGKLGRASANQANVQSWRAAISAHGLQRSDLHRAEASLEWIFYVTGSLWDTQLKLVRSRDQ
jgi:hypothetical protein